ncbi:MAG: DUF1501 domain-containing protein, partial [Saprospiraceae bacterium]|nr:DUF1501 domain-containing protein [Saprospiraceae bacterium]
MKRRSFLQSSSIFSLPVMLGGVNVGVLANTNLDQIINADSDRIFVLIQQNGGNDGLNMIIPIDQYNNLSVARSNILIPENQIIKLNEKTGFHPAMAGMKSLFDESALTIVQNVGYANQNRSHFRSTDIWNSGSQADEIITTGWIGRYLDTQHFGYPEGYPNDENPHPVAITLGPTVSETCQGIAANFSLAINDPTALLTIPGTDGGELPDLPYGHELEFLRLIVQQTNVYATVLSEAAEKGTNLSTLYPDTGANRLADQLKIVAQLISGGLETKVYVVNINGFDTHANQVDANDPTAGDHTQLLADLSEGILAFMDDLRKLKIDQRVIGATRSEFGRQIASNGSLGTDHGNAAPLIVFGSCVNDGIIGENPEIPGDLEPQSGVTPEIDFKNVFGSILMDWFEASEADVRTLFSHEFEYLPLITACNTTTPTHDLPALNLYGFKPYPNPFFEELRINLKSPGGRLRISLKNNFGQEDFILADEEFSPGDHSFSISLP